MRYRVRYNIVSTKAVSGGIVGKNNGTFADYCDVEADSAEQAIKVAKEIAVKKYEGDISSPKNKFNVENKYKSKESK